MSSQKSPVGASRNEDVWTIELIGAFQNLGRCMLQTNKQTNKQTNTRGRAAAMVRYDVIGKPKKTRQQKKNDLKK